MADLNRSLVVVAYDRLCLFEFGVATELFGLERPEIVGDWYDFTVVAVDPGPLRTQGGVELHAPRDVERIEEAGTVVLPGWRDPNEPPPRRLVDALLTAHARGARLMSICSGIFVLAATGLLDHRPATTHWRYIDALRARFPSIRLQPDVLYVDDGSVLTSAGSAAGIDLGLHLIRRDHGSAVANQVARRLVAPPHREGGQAQFIERPVAGADEASLGPTLAWALERLDEALPVARLADHAHLSPRTFARRFVQVTGTTPHRWVTRQRVRLARELLETGSAGIDEIAARCGLGSAANLRRHFRRELRTTPTHYRRVFGGDPAATPSRRSENAGYR